jgi:hypothetical protein
MMNYRTNDEEVMAAWRSDEVHDAIRRLLSSLGT